MMWTNEPFERSVVKRSICQVVRHLRLYGRR
jgi:hypothetical protein